MGFEQLLELLVAHKPIPIEVFNILSKMKVHDDDILILQLEEFLEVDDHVIPTRMSTSGKSSKKTSTDKDITIVSTTDSGAFFKANESKTDIWNPKNEDLFITLAQFISAYSKPSFIVTLNDEVTATEKLRSELPRLLITSALYVAFFYSACALTSLLDTTELSNG